MTRTKKILLTCLLVFSASAAHSQSDSEELKIAALEALISAPPERALPIVQRVLNGNDSDEVKARALFILGHIDLPEAQAILGEAARNNSGELQLEAIRMVAINGDPSALAALAEIYAAGDEEVKEAVLHAYLIADDSDAVFQIALNTQDPDEFQRAVEMLGVMGATDKLGELRSRADMTEYLVDAYAIAGDFESLRSLAADATDPDAQLGAISALGIVGGPEVDAALLDIYRGTDSPEVKQAALEGMMIADYDDGVLALFRESADPEEKRELLEMLVIMDSDEVWDIIDATLDDQQ